MARPSLSLDVRIGNLAADPIGRVTGGGTQIAEFRVLTDVSFKRGDGTTGKATTGTNVVVYGRTAERVMNSYRKGLQVYVEGSHETRKYTDATGQARRFYRVAGRRTRIMSPKVQGPQGNHQLRALNSATLIGTLVAAPQAMKMGEQTAALLTLATDESYMGKEGVVERTEFHDVLAFGDQARVLLAHGRKGESLHVSGRREEFSFEKKDGAGTFYGVRVRMDTFNFVGANGPRGDVAQSAPAPEAAAVTGAAPGGIVETDDAALDKLLAQLDGEVESALGADADAALEEAFASMPS